MNNNKYWVVGDDKGFRIRDEEGNPLMYDKIGKAMRSAIVYNNSKDRQTTVKVIPVNVI